MKRGCPFNLERPAPSFAPGECGSSSSPGAGSTWGACTSLRGATVRSAASRCSWARRKRPLVGADDGVHHHLRFATCGPPLGDRAHLAGKSRGRNGNQAGRRPERGLELGRYGDPDDRRIPACALSRASPWRDVLWALDPHRVAYRVLWPARPGNTRLRRAVRCLPPGERRSTGRQRGAQHSSGRCC